jgi:hypothetical protein
LAQKTQYEPLNFSWIGMGKQRAICVTWHTSPIKSWDDAKARVVNVSATGATSNNATLPRLLNHLTGTQFKVITGYSTSGMRLAMEKGEVEGICGLSYQTLIASAPQWFQGNQLTIIGQLGIGESAVLPGVPNVLDLVTDKTDHEALALLVLPQEMGRPHVAPPNVPPIVPFYAALSHDEGSEFRANKYEDDRPLSGWMCCSKGLWHRSH